MLHTGDDEGNDDRAAAMRRQIEAARVNAAADDERGDESGDGDGGEVGSGADGEEGKSSECWGDRALIYHFHSLSSHLFASLTIVCPHD